MNLVKIHEWILELVACLTNGKINGTPPQGPLYNFELFKLFGLTNSIG